MFAKPDTLSTFRSMSGSLIESLPIEQSFALLIDFYELHRASDTVPVSEEGDMLLFQWGPNKWAEGAPFEINLTRQFIYPDEEDYEMYHLSLTYSYLSDDGLDALEKGNAWYSDPLDTAQAREQILTSNGVTLCASHNPSLVTLNWGQV